VTTSGQTTRKTTVRNPGLYDAEGELVTPDDMSLVQTARLRCKGAKTDGTAFSTAVEIHRISVDLLLDDDVDHLSTRSRVKRLWTYSDTGRSCGHADAR
jgi:hypothetical protein